jgi:diaminopimelate decarboxylase
MQQKPVPFTKDQMEEILHRYPSPVHIYDEHAIRTNAKRLDRAFAWNKGFREFFSVKATPNPYIIKILADEGFGTDCSSLPELILSEKAGVIGESIMFSSNNTPADEYQKAKELGAIINLDDITHVPYLETHAGLPELISFRYNPGSLAEGNEIIGNPTEAKYGFTHPQLIDGYRATQAKGVQRFGLHTMIASNMLDIQFFFKTIDILFDIVLEVYEATGIKLEFINMGGGIGIPYKPDEEPISLELLGEGVCKRYEQRIIPAGLDPLCIYMENGRMITGPYGYVVSRVIHRKDTYKTYIGLDASMQNLMRPAIYGAYHHITVLGKENQPASQTVDVTGSLCENNDKFAIDRDLPSIEIGDLLVIHDTGAHGHAMGFNYNGKLRSAELLLKPDGSVEEIRRAETLDDYFATLDFSRL